MNFTDVLDDHGVPWTDSGPKAHAGWVNFACPMCGKDPYMGYSLSTHAVHCWSCGRHSLRDVLLALTGLSEAEVRAMVGSLPWGPLPPARKAGKLKRPGGLESLTKHHRDYLTSRGFCPYRVARDWDVQGIGVLGGRLRWRLFIPIHFRGRVVSWTTRSLGREEPRYLSASREESDIAIEDLLYGIDYCGSSVLVVEGPLDVWRVGPGAAATLGMSAGTSRLAQLARFPFRAVCYDNEPDAQARALALCDHLAVFGGTTVNVRLRAKDPASAGEEELENLRGLLR